MYPCLGLNVTAGLFSQPGTAVHSRVEGSRTAYLWRRNGDANLKNVIYPCWNSEIICIRNFFPSVCTHVWQPFSSVFCLCAMVAGDWLQRAVRCWQDSSRNICVWVPACIQLCSATAATASPHCMEAWRNTCSHFLWRGHPPRKSYAVFLNLLFRWEHALEFGLKNQKWSCYKITGQGLMWYRWLQLKAPSVFTHQFSFSSTK